ncbi:MAG TPA: hypothetical protein VII55_00370, partial [Candidatus Saccharimonadales bacterium]
MALPNKNETVLMIKRVRIWYGLLILVLAIFIIRLFYIQVINHAHYRAAALSDQLKQYQIPANRGIIEAHEGAQVLPIVLNQQLYTLYADPVNVKNADQEAAKLVPIVGGNAGDYAALMKTAKTRYAVLFKKLTADQQAKISSLKL